MKNLQEIENKLSEPSYRLVREMKQIDGDILILGVGGKMGPTLAKMAKRAADQAGQSKKVIGVSRFSNKEARIDLENHGVETITADLLDEAQLKHIPDCPNIIFMAGHKFGTVGNESFTWAMNSYLPGRIAQRWRDSRYVCFSSGNLYPMLNIGTGGATESYSTGPIGEYAQSCLGRERVFEHFAKLYNIKMVHFRLNYAIDLRYGVLLDIAKQVYENKPIDLQMSHVNVIWQGDANEMAIRSLLLASNPPLILNITGPETISIRWTAEEFAKKFGRDAIFSGEENGTALLSNASKAHQLLGYPLVSLRQMLDWVADWVKLDGATINKPTHFQERKGVF